MRRSRFDATFFYPTIADFEAGSASDRPRFLSNINRLDGSTGKCAVEPTLENQMRRAIDNGEFVCTTSPR